MARFTVQKRIIFHFDDRLQNRRIYGALSSGVCVRLKRVLAYFPVKDQKNVHVLFPISGFSICRSFFRRNKNTSSEPPSRNKNPSNCPFRSFSLFSFNFFFARFPALGYGKLWRPPLVASTHDWVLNHSSHLIMSLKLPLLREMRKFIYPKTKAVVEQAI